jgi:uncharacterized protein (TIGR03067 family)
MRVHRTPYLLAALLALPLLGSDMPKEDDGVAEVADDIRGTWELTEIQIVGRGQIGIPLSDRVTIYRGGVCWTSFDVDDVGTVRSKYRLDPARKPAHLDVYEADGKYRGQTLRCIYAVEGDTLRVAHMADHKDRFRYPQGFAEEAVQVMVYERLK